jgi:hypothetical protein
MDTEMSDLELLGSALEDAMDARRKGVLIGPALDSVAFERAERRARHQDVARLLRTAVVGDAA